MQDSVLIWNFLTREYPDNHLVIYLYACGSVRSPNLAIDKIMEDVKVIFSPPIPYEYLVKIVKGFLEMKKKQYIKGEIKINPIY